jgi:uncharacterized membrane protein YdjX (TVP38/TMEM64 family)
MLVALSILSYIAYTMTGMGIQGFTQFLLSYGSSTWIALSVLTIIFISIGLPIIIPAMLASLLFDTATASLLICLSMYIGISFAFFIARWLGKEYVEEKFINKNKYLKSFDQKLETHGFYTILISRFMFIIPFEFVNLLSGVSKVRFKEYFLATVIGATPGTILSIYMFKELQSINTLQFVVASGIFLILTLIPLLIPNIRKHVF